MVRNRRQIHDVEGLQRHVPANGASQQLLDGAYASTRQRTKWGQKSVSAGSRTALRLQLPGTMYANLKSLRTDAPGIALHELRVIYYSPLEEE
jgi:hypothetical protein